MHLAPCFSFWLLQSNFCGLFPSNLKKLFAIHGFQVLALVKECFSVCYTWLRWYLLALKVFWKVPLEILSSLHFHPVLVFYLCPPSWGFITLMDYLGGREVATTCVESSRLLACVVPLLSLLKMTSNKFYNFLHKTTCLNELYIPTVCSGLQKLSWFLYILISSNIAEWFLVVHLYFILTFKKTFYLEIILDLPKVYKDFTGSLSVPFTQFSLRLTSYITVALLPKLKKMILVCYC